MAGFVEGKSALGSILDELDYDCCPGNHMQWSWHEPITKQLFGHPNTRTFVRSNLRVYEGSKWGHHPVGKGLVILSRQTLMHIQT